MKDTTITAFQKFYSIIKKLRSPEGCPWDREQTTDSLKQHLLEEAYECIDAINENDLENIQEELGDVYLLVTMISYINQQENNFSIGDVLNSISEKLIRRHPHVFSDARADNSKQVLRQWKEIKKTEKTKKHTESILDSIPRTLPPLERAHLIQKKVSKVGFDWNSPKDVFNKIYEEFRELEHAIAENNDSNIEEEFGDLLFSLVNLSRFLNIDPMIALHSTNQKFYKRFAHIEEEASKLNKNLEDMELQEMDELWESTKNQEHKEK